MSASNADPLVCINARMVGLEPQCGEPESAHCEGCRMCPGLGNCTCRQTDPWLAKALDAFARNGNHANWQALDSRISRSCAESYRSDIAAAIAPLLAEIRRLTAELSATCWWNQGDRTVPVRITRTEGADIPPGHYEVLVIPTGLHHFALVDNLKHSKES